MIRMNGGWKWLGKWNIPAFYKSYRALKHSEYFDPEWYLARNPDVQTAGWNPLLHYLRRGYRENRNPSPRFNGVAYLELYADVRQSGMNPLVHYELFGRSECRFVPDGISADEIPAVDTVIEKYRVEGGDLCRGDQKTAQPFFSVIMPTFNRADRINRAVDSLLAQRYRHFELVICDDGSTDGTEAQVKSRYAEALAEERIVYLARPHAGCAAARNRALQQAKGDWIAYLDSDNEMHDDFLAVFAAFIAEHPGREIFYARAQRMQSGTITGAGFNREKLAAGNYIDLGTVIHARSIYEQLGGFDESLTRLIDWELLLRYTGKYRPVFVAQTLLEYNDSAAMARISNDCDFKSNWEKITNRRRMW